MAVFSMNDERFIRDESPLTMNYSEGGVMNWTRTIFALGCALLLLASCSVISRELGKEATPFPSFKTLIEEVDDYKGRTVILGGILLTTRNLVDETLLAVLQTPLEMGEKPAPRDRSEGRFILSHPGFLDPAIFEKDREITVAGVVEGVHIERIDEIPYTYLKLKSLEIHLWGYEDGGYRDSYYDPWCHPMHWRRHWGGPCRP